MSLRGFKPVGEEVTRTLGPEGKLAQGERSSKYKVEQFNTDDGLVTKVTNPNRNRIGFIGGNISREATPREIESKVTTWFALDRFKEGKPVVVSGP